MKSYELRVMNPKGKQACIYASSHISDFAAICRAISLAEDEGIIEVWRGMICIYSGPRMGALSNTIEA